MMVHRRLPCVARRMLLASIVAGLAGCTVGPNYTRPPVATPAAFSASHVDAQPLPPAWWEVYHDAVLDALVAKVAVDNQSLKAAAARMHEAQALLESARGKRIPSAEIGTFNVGHKNRRDVGLGFSWELDLWGRIRREIEVRGAAAEASANDLAAATLSMQAQLVQAYFALREKETRIAALRPLLAADTQWADTVARQHAAGVASAEDLADAHERLAGVTLQVTDAQLARARLEHAIAVMVGRPPEGFAVAPGPFTTRVPLVPAGVPSTLLQRRPDIAAAERRMAEANAQVGVRTAEMYPALKLVAGVSVSHGLFATPTGKVPLYAGGTMRANVAFAQAGYAEAVARYRQTVLDAFREVEDNLAAQELLAKAATTQAAATASTRNAARVAANQYRAGVIDYGAVAAAQAAAFGSESAALQLQLQRLDASVDLVKATGGGWDNDAAGTQAGKTDAPAPVAGDGNDGTAH